jgi:hypothetical protein
MNMALIFTTSYFFWGALILLIGTLIFYLVSFGFLYYWHETKVSFIVVPFLLTFDFFIIAFFCIAFVCIFLQFAPDVFRGLLGA